MTHCDRILKVLADGQPHSHLELYALGTVAHSRISELRKRGHLIDQWRDGDLYLYRLSGIGPVQGPRDDEDLLGDDAGTGGAEIHPDQLTLEAA